MHEELLVAYVRRVERSGIPDDTVHASLTEQGAFEGALAWVEVQLPERLAVERPKSMCRGHDEDLVKRIAMAFLH